jgi:hypothetical protein
MKKFLLLLALVACDKDSVHEFISPHDNVANVTYVKDSRTGFCFAVSYVSEYPVGTANIYNNVPCTPEVERLIKPNAP